MDKPNQDYKVVIVDDEPAAREILLAHLEKIQSVEVVAACKSAMEAFTVLNTNKIDLVFLDINMPEISGLSFARTITKNVKVIFTTAYREFALDGFDLQAVDYLLKPISLERLVKALNKFMEESIPSIPREELKETPEKKEFVFVRSDRKMIKVNFTDILYVESLNDYIKIWTKEKVIVTRETISGIEAKLPKSNFLRCHRSYIIAIPEIDSFTNEYIEVFEKAIPISRSYKQSVLERLEGV